MMNRSILRTTVRLQSRMMSASAPVIDGPLGFVGLGHMGSKMVENLSRDGRKIMVYDASKEAVQKVVSASAAGNKSVTAASLEEMAQKCSIIFSMLPNDQVRPSYYV
jgi:3-hydroxyisobutyrate dehydrogenase-like beta-hydroxyacid dehydrogenase